ncbi:glycoside hydrolase family 3 C-terminal domain-containing protein [Leifsonia xyli]|uniref:beta-glucosidase family protein n=1 Tax=Leifsonia xyli TaxID=1575 RepID=UPI000AAE777E
MTRPFTTRLRRWVVPATAVGLLAGAITAGPALASGPYPAVRSDKVPAGCPWMDTTKSPQKRAQLLLAASTLDQKLRWLDEQAANNPTQTTFNGVTYPAQVPCTPKVVYSDGPDYVRGASGVTIFPAQLSLASSFDADLAYAKGKAQGDEAFRSGLNGLLSPQITSARTVLDGRITDSFGEDSLLSGDLAAAQTSGIQTGNPEEPVMSVLKHYIANEQELDRQTSSSNLDGRTLREVYDLAFQIAVQKSDPAGVMCSYNQVNGVYACENTILNNLLKAGGWDGYVVSDFGSVHSTAPSLNAGLDQELNRPIYYTPANIRAAIDNGSTSIAQVDAAASRVVMSYIRTGLFDHPLPTTPSTSASNAANRSVAERIAERGAVLLQNTDSVLPLTKKTKTIAIIGPTASKTPTNGVSAATVCAIHNFGPATACPNVVAPLDAITERAAKAGATVTFDSGSDPAAAAAAAAKADVAIVFGYDVQGEGADRTSLSLDGNGDALIATVAAANPNTVAVLETGSATDMPWLSSVKGVIQAWYPGEQGGTALARLIYGDANFSGKLPITFPKSLAETPTNTPAQYPGLVNGQVARPAGDKSIRQVQYSEGLAIGYKWYQSNGVEPLFPFGYGLSYTAFDYSKLQLAPAVINKANTSLKVSFTVTNTGKTTGTTTPQVYLTLPASTGEPGSRLVSFEPVTLRGGESKRVTVTIDPTSVDKPLSYYSTAANAWTTAPGTYRVTVGDSSKASLAATFTVAG